MLTDLIVGTGRCGTGFISRVLPDCGHEERFGPDGVRLGHKSREASWLAVPFLAAMDCRVVHLVRDPLLVYQSLYAQQGLFDDGNVYGKFLGKWMRMFDRHWNERDKGGKVELFMRTWYTLCSSYPMLKVEDIDEETVMKTWGTRPSAIKKWKGYNSRPRADVSVPESILELRKEFNYV